MFLQLISHPFKLPFLTPPPFPFSPFPFYFFFPCVSHRSQFMREDLLNLEEDTETTTPTWSEINHLE
jgi:hypothetical protein